MWSTVVLSVFVISFFLGRGGRRQWAADFIGGEEGSRNFEEGFLLKVNQSKGLGKVDV